MSAPLAAPGAPGDPAETAALASAPPGPLPPLRWSPADRKALVVAALLLEDDAESVAQLLPDKPAGEVEAVFVRAFKGSRAHECLQDLSARGFQPASLVGGWRREGFLRALGDAGVNNSAFSRASAALYAFDRGRVTASALGQMLLVAVGPRALAGAIDLASPFLVDASLEGLWQAVTSWDPDMPGGAPQHDDASAELPPGGKHICANCGACQTRVWRHGGGLTLCNACGMYAQKHASHRPADLVRIHLERLERERAAAEEERLAAAAAQAAGGDGGGGGGPQDGAQPMEEDGAGWGATTPRGAAQSAEHGGDTAWTEAGGAASDGSPSIRRSRRTTKAIRRLDAAFVPSEAIDFSLGALRGADAAGTPTSLAPRDAAAMPWWGGGGGAAAGRGAVSPVSGTAEPEWMEEDGGAVGMEGLDARGAHQAVEALLKRCSQSESDATAELAAEGLLRLRCDTPPASPLSKTSYRDAPGGGRLQRPMRSPDPAALGLGLGAAAARHAAAAAPPLSPPPAAAAPWGGPGVVVPPPPWSEAGNAGSRAASPCASGAGASGTPPTPPGSWAGGPTAPPFFQLPPQLVGGQQPSAGAGAAAAAQQALTRFGVEHRLSSNSFGESGPPLLAGMRAAAERLRLATGGSRVASPDMQPSPSPGARFTTSPGGGAGAFAPLRVGRAPVGAGAGSPRRRHGHPRRESSSDEEWVPREEGSHERGAAPGGGPHGRKGWRAAGGGYIASDGDEPVGYAAAGRGRGAGASVEPGLPLSPLARLPVAAAVFGGLSAAPPRSGSAPPSGAATPMLSGGGASGGRPQGFRSRGRPVSKEPKASSRGPCANCGVDKSILWRCHPQDDSIRLCNACGIYRRSTGRDRPTDGVFHGVGKDGQERVIRRTSQPSGGGPLPRSVHVSTPASEYRGRLEEGEDREEGGQEHAGADQERPQAPQEPPKPAPQQAPVAPPQQRQRTASPRPRAAARPAAGSAQQPLPQPAGQRAAPMLEANTVAAVIHLLQQHQQQLALQQEMGRQQQNAALSVEAATQAAAAALRGGGVARRGIAPVTGPAAPPAPRQQAWSLLAVGGGRGDASGASTPLGTPDSPGGGERTAQRAGAHKKRIRDVPATAAAGSGAGSGAAAAPGALQGRRA